MRATSLQRIGIAGMAALTAVGLLSGCAAKKKTADSAAAASTAAASAAAPSDTPSKVVATGGGKFCQQVAATVNNKALQAAETGTGADAIKTSVEEFKSIEGGVLKSAPGAIKADLVTLFGALDQFYGSLAKANYDFTKVDPSVMATLTNPAVQTAEQHVADYMKNTCGIDTGVDTSGDGPSAAASASAALASALAKLTASAAPAS